MAKKRNNEELGRYKSYQFAFRVKQTELKEIQTALNALYDKFNKGRDPQNPMGRQAVKINDIASKALEIGMAELRKLKTWQFEESED